MTYLFDIFVVVCLSKQLSSRTLYVSRNPAVSPSLIRPPRQQLRLDSFRVTSQKKPDVEQLTGHGQSELDPVSGSI